MQRYSFTWERGKGTDQALEQRLDRALVSTSWLNIFEQPIQSNQVAPISDHSPILLQKTVMTRFRFENKWCHEPELLRVMRKS